jgi:acyl-CoA synthetase
VVPSPFGFGLWTSHFTPTLLGISCHLQPRFDARAAAERITSERISVLCAVSSQFVMILDAADGLDLTSLRVLFTGGERLPLERSREFEERTGCSVLNFYGSNETGLLSGTRTTDPLDRRISTGGRCVPEMNVRLYDDRGRRVPGDRGTGRPACRGPATSPGYYLDDEANRELFTEEGWMLMGDYVHIDDEGWLTVIGRSADFIVRGGKNISAAAVEEEASTHPCVAEAAALPVPDARLGEIVGLCVSLRPGQDLDLARLKAHFAARGVSKEWWPERLTILDAMPRSSGGKIAKAELRTRIPDLFPEISS